ncbi:acyl-CoA synthetase [Rhizorhabdus dicambivorans]|uniref:Fatty-acid--CoA ligase n=1 Tax=Rhizorhabdus dicambivorans TaxID=1850238 RepID=A0A2A4FT75_9SPHN|nr:long-chain fatty acid--CoA ligase [Rhizorhabdus dicambivorans]ATE64710.1 fatty-acid--CoA ligase [Rhizorhabdus dicambivorans]PCE41349.1 fatty-acid--CoA ligase [Rhizorhabdus dicambivorans]
MQFTQGLHRSSKLYRSRTATVFGDRSRSWGTIQERVARLAGGLASYGVERGDRVAIFDLNSDLYFEAYFAIAWAGCVAVPFNTRWAEAEVTHALTDCMPRIVFLGSAFKSYSEQFARAGVTVIGIDEPIGGSSIEAVIWANDAIEDRCGCGDDVAVIFYTGGTTGKSKGVMLSHNNLILNFFMMQAMHPHATDAVYLHAAPMFHLADAAKIIGITMLGGTHVVLPGFAPAAVIEAIVQHQVSDMMLVPTMIDMLCQALAADPQNMSSIRSLTYGGSPIAEPVLKAALLAFPNARFCQAYGQTELSPCATILEHRDHLGGRLRSAGRMVPGVDLRIVDSKMRTLAIGEIGEVAVRGANVMQGYWGQPELTAQTIVGGWLRTGDAGYLDEDGFLYLVDRVKDMIVSGGENVYSCEVEQALLSHGDVLQCAVFGIPSEQWGEAVHAVVMVRPDATVTPDDLLAHCGPLIANYKRPKSFELRHEPLPLSAVGKILKTELRKPFWQGAERRIG